MTKKTELTESVYERAQIEHASAETNLRQFLDAVASLQNTLSRANTDIKVWCVSLFSFLTQLRCR